MKLNALCQSPVYEGMTETDAINNTIQLAKETERLGYHRFWVSEHHNFDSFASASPEILTAQIGAVTSKIRVGTAGILISNYSPYKIAEQANMLSLLMPNRFDLGIGRAGGTDTKTLQALESHLLHNDDAFQRFDLMLSYLSNKKETRPHPQPEHPPEIWVLGTSVASARYAAVRGLRYAFASFISDEECLTALQTYHQYFTPSKYLKSPYVNLAIFAICAETQEKADELVKTTEAWFIQSFLRGVRKKFPTLKNAKSITPTFQEGMLLEARRRSRYAGDPEYIAKELKETATSLQANELTIVTITEHLEDRIKSYQLIADQLL